MKVLLITLLTAAFIFGALFTGFTGASAAGTQRKSELAEVMQ